MPTVRISRYECERNLLPRVCARCGKPANSGVRLILLTPFHDVAAGLVVWFCPLLILFGAAALRTRRGFEVPMCERDRTVWNRRHWRMSVSFVVFVVGSYSAALVALLVAAFADFDREIGLALVIGCVMGYLVIGLIWIIANLIVWAREVHAGSYMQHGLRLSGVHADFIQAIGADRVRARDSDPARLGWFGDDRDDFDDVCPDGSPRPDAAIDL